MQSIENNDKFGNLFLTDIYEPGDNKLFLEIKGSSYDYKAIIIAQFQQNYQQQEAKGYSY